MRLGAEESVSIPSPIAVRWAVAAAALAVELLWLASTHDAPHHSQIPNWRLVLVAFNEGHHYTAAIIFSATFLLVVSANYSQLKGILSKQDGYRWYPWAALHAIAFFIFHQLTSLGFGTQTGAAGLSLRWVILWASAGSLYFFSWLLILAPAHVWSLALPRVSRGVLVAVAAVAATWIGGLLAQQLWRPLADGTLRLSSLLLSLSYSDVSYDPALGLLGSEALMVMIYPSCSGYEGIALVTVFVAAYLWLFRHDLPFPKAFILLPLGIVCIWLVNVLRVTALVAIGTSVSPEVATVGFHPHAGWIGFSAVSLGLIALSHRWISAGSGYPFPHDSATARPELPLLLPLMVLMATTMFIAALSDGVATLYPLGVLVTGAVLWNYRAAYRPLFGPLTWEPFAIGTLVFGVWILLVPGSAGEDTALPDRLADWPAWLAAGWLLFRVLGSVITVPLAEELAFRGYLIRKLVARDFEQVRPGHFTWFSFILTSLLFGLLHQHLLAGALAGAAYALALYRRGRVGDAILAHVTSNALIAIAVLAAGQWGLWA